jgi:hypothetical protein
MSNPVANSVGRPAGCANSSPSADRPAFRQDSSPFVADKAVDLNP